MENEDKTTGGSNVVQNSTAQLGAVAPSSLINTCKSIRESFSFIEKRILALKVHPDFKAEQSRPDQHGEAIANIMLAYRHAEDSRMRLGKVIQAMEDGISKYDK